MSPPRRPANDGERRAAEVRLQREMGKYLGLGLQFAASVGLLTFGGYWLDGRVGTLPLFTVLGALLGFIGATLSLVRQVPSGRGPDRGDPPTPQ